MIDLYEEQIKNEQEQLDLTRVRYQNRINLGLSSTRPGQCLLAKYLPAYVDRLNEEIYENDLSKTQRELQTKIIISTVKREAIASIVIRTILDTLTREEQTFTQCATAIGKAVVNQRDLDAIKKENALKYERNFIPWFQTSHDEPARNRKINAKLLRADIKLEKIATHQRAKIGMLLIKMFEESTNLIATSNIRKNNGRNSKHMVKIITCSDALRAWLSTAHNASELIHPLRQPMIVKPREWTTGASGEGGYLIPEMDYPLFKAASKAQKQKLEANPPALVIKAANAVQSTPWRINKQVLAVMDHHVATNNESTGLMRVDPFPIPERPESADYSSDENVKWRKAAAAVYTKNSATLSNRLLSLQRVNTAKKYAGHQSIWFPIFSDSRGRFYNHGSSGALSPQGSDFSKGLLEFGNAKPLGEDGAYHMAVHIANAYGEDKISLDGRVAWVEDNEDKMIEVAMDPLENTWWTKADEPWQFLAGCFEWVRFRIEGDDFVSRLPIQRDATASGLQHLSSMARDGLTAQLCNVIPSLIDAPADVYSDVAKQANNINNVHMLDVLAGENNSNYKDELITSCHGKWVRQITKPNVMTMVYGSTQFGMSMQVKAALEKLDGKGEEHIAYSNIPAANYMTAVNREAMATVLEGPTKTMEYFQATARLLSETNEQSDITWETPLGLPVHQSYKKYGSQVVECWYQGVRTRIALRRHDGVANPRRHAAAINANLVHSMDATHMQLTVLGMLDEVDNPSFSMVHDSFGTHACDCTALDQIIRSAWVEMYSQNVMETFHENFKAQLPESDKENMPDMPLLGDLDVTQVENSNYFFH